MELDAIDEKMPLPLTAIYAVKDDPKQATPIHTLFHGDYLHPRETVGARPLGILLPEDAPEDPITMEKPRLKLANWLVDPDNPLTARVMVNRIWQYHFGRGIVSTANDFGRMGGKPSNPELLDYLANQYVEGGWQHEADSPHDSAFERVPAGEPIAASKRSRMEKDSENALLWKFSRRRLEAEEIRDSMLAISGRLNPKDRRPQRDAADRSRSGEDAQAPAILGGDQGHIRIQPPHVIHDLQAQSAAAFHGRVRCAGYAAFLPAPRTIHARAAGSGIAERADCRTIWRSLSRPVWPRSARPRRSASI